MSNARNAALTIQRAGGDELDEVLGVINAAFDPRFGEAWTRNQCAGILPMAGVSLTVARQSDAIVGFSLARRILDEAELLLIAVRPECRGTGIASRLLEHFVAQQQQAGVNSLHLEVRGSNPAVELYAKHGFAVAGRRANYYRGTDGEKFDALTMVRSV